MKRWAIVTVVLYGLLLLLLIVPLLMLFGLDKTGPENTWRWSIGPADALEVFRTWWFWITLGVFALAQGTMLIVPVAAAEHRPKARRRLLVPVVTAAFLLANLFFAGLFAVLIAAMGEEGASKLIEWPADLTTQTAGQLPAVNGIITGVGFTPNANFFSVINLIGLFLLFWMLWGLIFFHFAKADEPETLTRRATRWLLRGSILELLIAVPSHIIVRNRNDCCAPFVTFWGIVTGICVTLLAFGPGVYFLLVARMRTLRPKATPDNSRNEIPPTISPPG
jgi:hypothetical protein